MSDKYISVRRYRIPYHQTLDSPDSVVCPAMKVRCPAEQNRIQEFWLSNTNDLNHWQYFLLNSLSEIIAKFPSVGIPFNLYKFNTVAATTKYTSHQQLVNDRHHF